MTTYDGPSDPAFPAAGALPVIPEITLLRELARGGMGIVFRARQDFLEREVAVKLLAPHLVGERFGARFRREAKLLAGIHHPHIVACHSAGVTPQGQHYLVMELVEGPNLEAWIAEHGPVPTRSALRLTSRLAQALGHACELGVIHRDIKSANILLEEQTGTTLDPLFPYLPKLVDLGLARMMAATTDPAQTAPGAVMGTPATMAPEQFDAPDSVDFRADIYGLGCVLYEMLTGTPAFPSQRLTELVVAKRQPRGPNPCANGAGIPPAVGELVASMLAHDPNARPADYRTLRTQLEALANAPSGTHGAAPSAAPSASEPGKPTTQGGPGLLRTTEFEFLAAGHDAAHTGAAGPFTSQVAEPDPAEARTVPARTQGGLPPVGGERGLVPHAPRELAPAAQRIAPRTHSTPPRVVGARVVASESPAHGRSLWSAIAFGSLLTMAAVPWLREHGAHDTQHGVEAMPHAPLGRSQPMVRTETRTPTNPERRGPARPSVDLLADFLADDGTWQSNGRARAAWRQRNDGAVIIVAGEMPNLSTRKLTGDAWRVVGAVVPERADGQPPEPREGPGMELHPPPPRGDLRRGPRGLPPRGQEPRGPELRGNEPIWNDRGGTARPSQPVGFAQAAVTVHVSPQRQLAMVCTRSGNNGEHWVLSLQEIVREADANGLGLRPLADGNHLRIEANHVPMATFAVAREGDELQFEFGFAGRSDRITHREPIEPEHAEVPLSLLARAGRVVFPALKPQ